MCDPPECGHGLRVSEADRSDGDGRPSGSKAPAPCTERALRGRIGRGRKNRKQLLRGKRKVKTTPTGSGLRTEAGAGSDVRAENPSGRSAQRSRWTARHDPGSGLPTEVVWSHRGHAVRSSGSVDPISPKGSRPKRRFPLLPRSEDRCRSVPSLPSTSPEGVASSSSDPVRSDP